MSLSCLWTDCQLLLKDNGGKLSFVEDLRNWLLIAISQLYILRINKVFI